MYRVCGDPNPQGFFVSYVLMKPLITGFFICWFILEWRPWPMANSILFPPNPGHTEMFLKAKGQQNCSSLLYAVGSDSFSFVLSPISFKNVNQDPLMDSHMQFEGYPNTVRTQSWVFGSENIYWHLLCARWLLSAMEQCRDINKFS